MNYIKDINLKNYQTQTFNMIVEIPKGTNKKYELVEPTFDKVECVRKVYGKYVFDYGCFPQTLAGDGDALDAILISTKKHKSLDIVEVKPIGVIKTIDNGEQDNKIIVTEQPIKDKLFDKLLKIAIKFLKKYKGKKSNMILDTTLYMKEEAVKEIEDCNRAYLNKESKDTSTTITMILG